MDVHEPYAIPPSAAVEAAIRVFDTDDYQFESSHPSPMSDCLSTNGACSYDTRRRASVWICLDSQVCRDPWTVYPLHGGKSSNATNHLKEAHSIVAYKT